MSLTDDRIRDINSDDIDPSGKYVLYWMQQSQRTRFNHALEYALRLANELDKPLVVCFGLMDDYPEANERHYAFMLEGLRDVDEALEARGIKFVCRHGRPDVVANHYAARAAVVVCDRGYLRHQKAWREAVAHGAGRRVVQVESDAVVPVQTASDKREFAARTIRPKIMKRLDAHLVAPTREHVKHRSTSLDIHGDIDVTNVDAALAKMKIDRSVGRVMETPGGERAAANMLKLFVKERLNDYAEGRNEPSVDHTSRMSAFLHFGQVSPIELALAVRESGAGSKADRDSYVEELVVRRELSINFVHFSHDYDQYETLPEWARKTLANCKADPRPAIYSVKQLEAAETGDRYWNAAQTEMVRTGYMHNYMRMYWGKRFLEWTHTPKQAYETLLAMNNKWHTDGRDCTAYGNVAWIFGLHDRPWGPARKIFGTVRYMNAAGLERKFDMEAYVNKWA